MTSVVVAPPHGALEAAVAKLFAGAPSSGPPTVGIELELIPYRLRGHGVVPIAESRSALCGVPHVSFEPGGQIELNPPPEPTVDAACAQLARLKARVDRQLRAIGVATVAIGLNPWHTVDELGLQLDSPRYRAMDAHFERLGTAGRMFMRQTASTQICVGLASGDHGLLQWRAANLVAPVLAALFANSPSHQGRRTTSAGARTEICRNADAARSRHGVPPLTVDEYVDFARAAAPLDQSFVGDDAVDAHLSTLFPPVRPRGTYLEFRAIDAQSGSGISAAAALVACLLAAPSAAAAAADVCGRHDPQQLWDHAADAGLGVREMRRLAMRLLDVASATTSALPADYLPADTLGLFAHLARRVDRSG